MMAMGLTVKNRMKTLALCVLAVLGARADVLPVGEDCRDSFKLRLRYRDLRCDGRKYTFDMAVIGRDTLAFGISTSEKAINGIDTGQVADVSVTLNGRQLSAARVTDIASGPDLNLLTVRGSGTSLVWSLGCGKSREEHAVTLPEPLRPEAVSLDVGKFDVGKSGRLDISEFSIQPADKASALYGGKPGWAAYDVRLLADATDTDTQLRYPLAGDWKIYDYDFDDSACILPVDYEFKILPTADGGYDVILAGGGRGDMRPGDVKARLQTSGFPDVWDVEWLTADGRLLHDGIRLVPDYSAGAADDVANGIGGFRLLKVSFPLQSASFRLRRKL